MKAVEGTKRCKIELSHRFNEEFSNQFNAIMKTVKFKKGRRGKKGKKGKK